MGSERVRFCGRWIAIAFVLIAPVFLSNSGAEAEQPPATNRLYVHSEVNNSVTRGASFDWVEPTISANVYPESLSLAAGLEDSGLRVRLGFGGEPVQTGFFDARSSFDGPTISASMEHRGCSPVGGWFDVQELAIGPDGELEKIAVDFAVFCKVPEGAVFGAIRLNSARPIDTESIDSMTTAVPNGRVYMTVPLASEFIGGSTFDYQSPQRVFGATVTKEGVVAVRINNSGPKYPQSFQLSFSTGSDAEPGEFLSPAGQTESTLSVRLFEARIRCLVTEASDGFVLHEIDVGHGGLVTRLAIDFFAECPDGSGVYGALRMNSDIPIDTDGLDRHVYVPFLLANPSDCPELTDSIFRLYTAYFLREPDTSGFEYWLDVYGAQDANLSVISASFARSREFQLTYGGLSDSEFVDLVYWNVLGRTPDHGGRRHWLSVLERGIPRGDVMLSFSESEEFVAATQTAPPLAGYLSWYGAGVHFLCGRRIGVLPVAELGLTTPHADLFALNDQTVSTRSRFAIFSESLGRTFSTDWFLLQPQTFALDWNLSLDEFDATTLIIENEGDVGRWAIVVYAEPHSQQRVPYTSPADRQARLAYPVPS